MPHRAGGKTPGDHQEQTARRPIVATLEQSLDVNVSIDVAREQWARFVKWVLVGNYKFACDAFSCARAADSEIVDFRELEPGMTRVHVNRSGSTRRPRRHTETPRSSLTRRDRNRLCAKTEGVRGVWRPPPHAKVPARTGWAQNQHQAHPVKLRVSQV
jgi:hypothetical protein